LVVLFQKESWPAHTLVVDIPQRYTDNLGPEPVDCRSQSRERIRSLYQVEHLHRVPVQTDGCGHAEKAKGQRSHGNFGSIG
jgi:hypothetical protein